LRMRLSEAERADKKERAQKRATTALISLRIKAFVHREAKV